MEEIEKIGGAPATSPLCVAEVQAGVRKGEEEKTNQFLGSLEICDLNRWIADDAGRYVREYRGKGITLPLRDTLIATTCIVNHLILLTDNPKHYPIPELRIWLSHRQDFEKSWQQTKKLSKGIP